MFQLHWHQTAPIAFQAQVSRTGASAEAQLLDFVYYCTAAQVASLALGPATLGTLRQLAQRSATGADAACMPDLALEAATLAETCALPSESRVRSGRTRGLEAITTELAASALLRMTLGAYPGIAQCRPSCCVFLENPLSLVLKRPCMADSPGHTLVVDAHTSTAL